MYARFTAEQANEIRQRRRSGEKVTNLALEYKCNPGTIRNIINFENYGTRPGVSAPEGRSLLKEMKILRNGRRRIEIKARLTDDERARLVAICNKLQIPIADILMIGIHLIEKNIARNETT